MKYFKFAIFTFAFTAASCANSMGLDAVRLGVGKGNPAELHGARLAATLEMPSLLPRPWQWLWEGSIAHWKCRGDPSARYRHLHALGFAPEWSIAFPFFPGITPVFAASIGAVLISSDHMGHRDLGSRLHFQDQLGLGARFGKKDQFELSVRYLHYSNAGLCPPNQGVDLKPLVELGYRF